MGRTDDHNTTEKFRNKRSFDGKPVEPGKVLVPFRKETFNLPTGTYIQDNFTVMYLGEFEYDRHDPNHVDIISLDFEYENEEFDIEDTNTPSVEDQVIDAIEPEPMEDELQLHHDAVRSCLKLHYCRKGHK